MKAWGDEAGLFWDEPIRIGRTAATAGSPRRESFHVPPPPSEYRVPTEFPQIRRAPRISLDIETYDPNLKSKGPGTIRKDGFIVGVGVRTDDWTGAYYPIRHKAGPNIEPAKVLGWLREELREYRGIITGANLLYEGEWLATEGVIYPDATIYDVQWAEPILDENALKYNLSALAMKHLGQDKLKNWLKELYGDDVMQHFDQVHPGHASEYNQSDLDLPLLILDKQLAALDTEKLLDVFVLESRLYHLLLYMRQIGVRVDIAAAEQLQIRLAHQRKLASEKIRYLSGVDVDVWASASVARAFDAMSIPYPKTAKGAPSFTKDWLAVHPSDLASAVLECRKCDKFDGTFVQGYILDGAVNGRIHAMFHPLRRISEGGSSYGTVSGRFSSSNPNLQNIPARDDVFGPLVRALFIPEEGMDWWSNDQSQMEYRLLVHFAVLANCVGAKDAAEMYMRDPKTDFHELAAALTGLPRKQAKNINFGIVYGMGVPTLAAKLGKSREEAAPILDTYHGKMPFAKQIYKMASNRASDSGFVRTISSRKRRFTLWEPQHQDYSEGAERAAALSYDEAFAAYGPAIRRAFTHKALNSVLQGSNADFIKKAMADMWDAGLIGPGKPLHCQLTVHDELDGSKPRTKEADEALRESTRVMSSAYTLKVPVLISSSTGKNWAEAH